jgi:pimeloyl-ACP methyl ester carboxylesterase
MPIVIMAGTGELVDFAHQSGRLNEVLAASTLVPCEGAGHMVHHSAPAEVIDGINLAASRSAKQPPTAKQPISVKSGQRFEALTSA